MGKKDDAATYYKTSSTKQLWAPVLVERIFLCDSQSRFAIDPFGHSAAQGALFAYMSMGTWFPNRLDYQGKIERLKNRELEMVSSRRQAWGRRPQSSRKNLLQTLRIASWILLDVRCDEEPIMNNPKLEGYNVVKKSKQFVNYFRDECMHYRSREHTQWARILERAANFKNIDIPLSLIHI
eukprot:TRINITY_DN9477_c0_g1_i1.p1 TRINITY_DN9477_c0_g1~~TRINITY_DN9477_c0_g1_i1.p1  ORF type:complete len:181 (+),score=30.10 TRINITY_DN9477_c0_g1_i1:209-751(+)